MRPVEQLQLSPRVVLKPGDLFRTMKWSGPLYGEHPIGPFGMFTLIRLEANRTRVYAEAIDHETGMTHTLYVKGPRYKSRGFTFKVFKVRKTTYEQEEKRARRRRATRAS